METHKVGYHFFGLTEEILFLVRKNTKGRVWLFGGGVYRPIISDTYLNRRASADFDFIAEHCVIEPVVPPGWSVKQNTMGGFKFKKGELVIDLWSFDIHSSPKIDNKPWNINSVLKATPLNVQSIAYDLRTQNVIGAIGLKAIKAKVVKANFRPGLENYCTRKGITPEHYAKTKAESLGFHCEFS
jgi:hypothetical protein